MALFVMLPKATQPRAVDTRHCLNLGKFEGLHYFSLLGIL